MLHCVFVGSKIVTLGIDPHKKRAPLREIIAPKIQVCNMVYAVNGIFQITTVNNDNKLLELFVMPTSNHELLQLKNLGMASVNILHAIGINTFADLQRVGAVEAYLRIRSRDINVSKVMLYALQGALMNVHWNDLAPDLKAQLVMEAEGKSSTVQRQASA